MQTILVLEDDHVVASTLMRILRRNLPEVVVVWKESCAEATEVLRENDVKVIISDGTVADGHGLDLFARRESLGSRGAFWVFLSAEAAQSRFDVAREAACCRGVFEKPVIVLEPFLKVIRAALAS